MASLIPARRNGELAGGPGSARYLLLVGELAIVYLCESIVPRCWRLGERKRGRNRGVAIENFPSIWIDFGCPALIGGGGVDRGTIKATLSQQPPGICLRKLPVE